MDADEADQFFRLLKTRTYKADDEIVSRGGTRSPTFFSSTAVIAGWHMSVMTRTKFF